MKRTIPTAVAVALVGAGVALGPAAHAVTNPADNPRPIVVKGDDGKTYHDGEDTLPGYDDEACTYIPGAWFDFDNDRVRYADGQSIPWTEWDRATGYKEWLAKKEKGDQTGASPSSKPSTASKPSTTKGNTTKGGTTQGTKTPAASHPQLAAATTAADPSAEAPDAATTVAGEKAAKKGKKPKKDAEVATTEPAEAAAAPESDVIEATSAKSAQSSSAAGLLILGGLGTAGLAVFAGWSLFRRRRKGASF